MLKKEFVRIYSPGTFVAEDDLIEVSSRDVNAAIELARGIVQRHGARPYGFQFETHGRRDDELNSKIIDRSPMYYFNGNVRTLAQVMADNKPDERILRSNMQGNGYDRIIETQPHGWTLPLKPGDVVLRDTL